MQGKKETEDYGKNNVTEKRQRRGPDLADLMGHRREGDPTAAISCNVVGARPVKASRFWTELQHRGGNAEPKRPCAQAKRG